MSHNDPITKDEAAKKAAARQSRSISPSDSHPEPYQKNKPQPPTHYELGASVPSASAVAEASDHRPSVLGATG